MQKIDVYLSSIKQSVDISPDATLTELRSKLQDAEDYNFMYYNTFTEKKTVLNDRSLEASRSVSQITLDNIISMARVYGSKTDLVGMKTDWLHDRHTGVKITLNTKDSEAKAQNAGKFSPIMITDVQPTNPSVSAFYDRAVICEKGSVINFDISSWGAAGFGYSIQSNKETICEYLYNSFGDNPDRKAYSQLRRYKESKNTIQIESTDDLGIPSADVINYQKITVKTWRMTSYKKDGKTYKSNTQAPLIQANGAASISLRAGYDPGDPEGDIYIPGTDIETAAPGQGSPSEQSFGTISNIQQDDRDNTVLGAVVFYFFVFKDKEAANRVINVLNTPDPNAIG